MKHRFLSRILRVSALLLCLLLLAGLLGGCALPTPRQVLLAAVSGPATIPLLSSTVPVQVDSNGDALPCYRNDNNGITFYVSEDLNRVSTTEYDYTLRAFYFLDGVLQIRTLATRTVYFNASGQSFAVCKDYLGNAISDSDYADYADRFFASCTKVMVSPNNGTVSQNSLIPAATPYPTPAPTPTPNAANFNGPAPVITKNPTSESLSTGGTTWFIAHARNADRLTWQVVSPEGLVYSAAEAMKLHPGLALENEANDTLAVRNIPFTLNGWGFQARFEGTGGVAVSSVAYVYVADYVTAYQSVLDAYRSAYQVGSHSGQYASEKGLSTMISHSPHVGYAFKDLDKDGIPELFIAGLNADNVARSVVYDVYCLVNGTPKRLAVSSEPDRFYLCTDNTLFNSGSSDAGHSYYFTYRFGNNRLKAVDGYMSSFTGSAKDGYYYQTGSYSPDPRNGDVQLTKNVFESRVRERENTVFQLILTKIA